MAKATLDFEVEEQDGIQVVHISGPLDSATYSDFKAYMDPIVYESRTKVVLDCHKLTYVNSHGVTLMMQYQKAAKVVFSFFGVAAFRPYILKGVERLGLSESLKWYPTLEHAMETAAAV
jgi:anti-anti-sigma factor